MNNDDALKKGMRIGEILCSQRDNPDLWSNAELIAEVKRLHAELLAHFGSEEALDRFIESQFYHLN